MPQFDLALPRIDPWVVVLLSVMAVIFVAFVVNRAIRVHRHRIAAGREDLLGRTAEVRTALKPRGTVFIQGEHWKAVSKGGSVEVGEEVVIIEVDNLVLSVVRREQVPSADRPISRD